MTTGVGVPKQAGPHPAQQTAIDIRTYATAQFNDAWTKFRR
jgi:hypothetical protein